MHEDDVEVVRAELAKEAINVGFRLTLTARGGLRGQDNAPAIDLLQGLCGVGVAAVLVSQVPEQDSLPAAVEQQLYERVHTQSRLI